MSALLALVRSELTKILTLPSLRIFFGALLVLHVAIQVVPLGLYIDAVAGIDANGMIEIFEGERVPAVLEITEQLLAGMFAPVPLLPVAGALVAGSEFWTGQIGVSAAASASRVRLVAAKSIATALVTVTACVVLALITNAVMFPAVRDWDPSILVSGGVLDGYLRVTLVAVCATLVALGLTLLTRRALVGILVMAVLLGVTISQVVAALAPAVDAALPISAARNLLFSDSPDVLPPLTSGPSAAAIVLVVWALAAVAASAAALTRRDAR